MSPPWRRADGPISGSGNCSMAGGVQLARLGRQVGCGCSVGPGAAAAGVAVALGPPPGSLAVGSVVLAAPDAVAAVGLTVLCDDIPLHNYLAEP